MLGSGKITYTPNQKPVTNPSHTTDPESKNEKENMDIK